MSSIRTDPRRAAIAAALLAPALSLPAAGATRLSAGPRSARAATAVPQTGSPGRPLTLRESGDPQGAAVAPAVTTRVKQISVADARLFRKVTLRLKRVSLAEFCAQLQAQTGVELRASRAVADEKVTVFVKEQRARDLMRAVARLFGYFWSRSGAEGAYRYELNQDLKSQLAEEELRNRDANAALLALDAEMAKYRPYLEMSFKQFDKLAEQFQQLGEQERKTVRFLAPIFHGGGWGGVQLYHRLTPAERAALAAGQELVFRPDAPDPDCRLPAEWQRPMLESIDSHADLNGQVVPIKDVPGIQVNQVRLRINRSELGQASLVVRLSKTWPGQYGPSGSMLDLQLATGRSPSVVNPDNATANAALRGRPPFDRLVSWHPEPSCPGLKGVWTEETAPMPRIWMIHDLKQPHVFSADVWEAIHRETGLPIVADAYTRLCPVAKVVVSRKTLFEALCQVGDAMGVRWTKDGDFLLGRSTSYFWDKLKEVPNRFLQRWAQDRKANGGLPLADFLEMASLSDQQLGSSLVAEGIMYGWGLRGWSSLVEAESRRRARFLATLTLEQRQRALQPEGLPFKEFTPEQQEAAFQRAEEARAVMESEAGDAAPIKPDWWAHAEVHTRYVPAGWYSWMPSPSDVSSPGGPIGGRTAGEALSAARRVYPPASPQEVRYSKDGWFDTGFSFVFHGP